MNTSRRTFLRTALLASAAPAALGRRAAARTAGAGPIRRELFIAAPRPGASVCAASYYRRRTGLEVVSVHEIFTRSDTVDIAYYRYSPNNGRTWTAGEEFPTFGVRPGGKLRRAMRGCVVDPTTGRFIRFYLEAVLPTDDPLEGMRQWKVFYSASEDGGLSWYVNEQVMQRGAGFGPEHPIPGVHIGHNGFMIGDLASRPIILADGTFLVPLMIPPAGPSGDYYNPGGGYTYSDVAVLRGRWAADGRHLEWELSSLVKIDPRLSTRGMDEGTLTVLGDGRILLVLRGSNDKRPNLPGRRWVAYSSDQGRSWTAPVPWTYSSGETFHSPASSSQLLTHSSGRIFWLGNITPTNPTGNRPRYPFVIGEVDGRSGLLERDTLRVVDDRRPGDGELLALSSPSTREDRATGEIVLNLTRWGALSKGQVYDWTAHAYLYRIPVI